VTGQLPKYTLAILCKKFVSDIAVFVLKRDVKLQLTNYVKSVLLRYTGFITVNTNLRKIL